MAISSFLAPLITAWDAADRGNADARADGDRPDPGRQPARPAAAEERALILLKFRRTAEAEPFARRAIGSAGGREDRLRLAFADGFLAAGDRARALMMLDGMSSDGALRAPADRGRQAERAGDRHSAKALSEVLTAFAADLARLQRAAPPIGLVQVARYANPQNSSATALLALLLEGQDGRDEALALLRDDPAERSA